LPEAKTPVWLFALFGFYGPALGLIGELRYVEIAVLVLLALNLSKAVRYLSRWEMRFIQLILLAAFSQAIADLYNNSTAEASLKRVGSYLIMALLIVAMKWLSRGEPLRVKLILGGYCFSYLFIAMTGIETPSRWYQVMPWRLGLGIASTIFLCLMIAWFPRLQRWGGLALIVMAGAHALQESRAIASVTGATGLLVLWTQYFGRNAPAKFDPGRVTVFALLCFAALAGTYQGLKLATEYQMFPPDMQKKMEGQINSEYGLLAAGRPDTITAIYAISKRPLLGYGTGNVDPDVYNFYSEISSSAYFNEDNYWSVYTGTLNREWTLGIPSHSHLFGSWADGGILASFVWVAMLYLCIYLLARMSVWRNEWVPLVVFISIMSIWDVLFSPGPHRMDIAVRLMVLIFAADMLRRYDYRAAQAGATGRTP
jgi:hypothetical protein